MSTTRDIPEKGTPEYALWLAAIDIAAKAPLQQNARAGLAQIPWPHIHELREALDQLGIDWREAHRKYADHRREYNRTHGYGALH